MHVSEKDHENCNRTRKKHVFCRENIAYLNRLIDKTQNYDNRTEDKTFDLCKLCLH